MVGGHYPRSCMKHTCFSSRSAIGTTRKLHIHSYRRPHQNDAFYDLNGNDRWLMTSVYKHESMHGAPKFAPRFFFFAVADTPSLLFSGSLAERVWNVKLGNADPCVIGGVAGAIGACVRLHDIACDPSVSALCLFMMTQMTSSGCHRAPPVCVANSLLSLVLLSTPFVSQRDALCSALVSSYSHSRSVGESNVGAADVS